MTLEEIKQELIDNGQDPNDYEILITENSCQYWKKGFEPQWFKNNKQIAKEEDEPIKQDVDIVAETTAITMMDMETLADTVVYLMGKVEELEGRLNG